MTTPRRSPAPPTRTTTLDAPAPGPQRPASPPGEGEGPAPTDEPPPAAPSGAPAPSAGRRTRRGPLPLLRRAPGAPPAVVAHRGSSATAPENTLAAFEVARRAGAPWIETDLRRTSDGVAVVLHDEGLDRTTDGAGALSVSSAAEVAALDAGSWFSPGFSGARVPALAELLAWAALHEETHLLLELKGHWTPPQADEVAEAVRAHDLAERVVLQSFDPRTVTSCAEVAPDLALGLLLREGGAVDPADTAAVAQVVGRLGLSAVNPGADEVAADPALVARLHDLGVAVWVWTVDDASRWGRLDAQGVDGVITNRPERMLGWVEGRASVPAPRQPRSGTTGALPAP